MTTEIQISYAEISGVEFKQLDGDVIAVTFDYRGTHYRIFANKSQIDILVSELDQLGIEVRRV